jgi:uncharacterized membrane protein
MVTFDVLLAIHVLSVVWWVGGVATVTAVLLPMFGRLPGGERIQRIKQFEARFANQARIAVVLVGITGFWMLALTGGLARLEFVYGWWIDLMLLVWVLFAIMLFIAEPLRLPAKVGLIQNPRKFLALHAGLLTLALAAIAFGVVGARGGVVAIRAQAPVGTQTTCLRWPRLGPGAQTPVDRHPPDVAGAAVPADEGTPTFLPVSVSAGGIDNRRSLSSLAGGGGGVDGQPASSSNGDTTQWTLMPPGRVTIFCTVVASTALSKARPTVLAPNDWLAGAQYWLKRVGL